ncbi:MAG: hypothetical protein JST20_04820 [Bacteroidetes bacterium]|nr:hypothetical protein [Bacteroidota bacterium]
MIIENNESWSKEPKMILKYVLQICFVIFVLILWTAYDIGFFRNGKNELKNNFIAHEKEFEELENYFYSVYPKDKSSAIWFEINNRDWYEFYRQKNFHLIVYPKVDSGEIYREIGGFYLEVGSPTLDSAIHYLGWTNKTLKQLQSKLSAVNCTKINSRGKVILLVNEHLNTWDPHYYVIYSKALQKDLTDKDNTPLSGSAIGKRTTIH